jgi:hypothetical protein
MRRDLERRLRAVEIVRPGANAGQVWIQQSDGMLRGPRGEIITRDAFEVVRSSFATILILPDNGRDPEFNRVRSGD